MKNQQIGDDNLQLVLPGKTVELYSFFKVIGGAKILTAKNPDLVWHLRAKLETQSAKTTTP